MDTILTATSTCNEITASSSECIYNFDITAILSYIGSVNFGLSVIIVILFISFVGYIYNKISSRKPWL